MPFDCFGLFLCRSTERCTCMQSNAFGAALKTPAQAEEWLRRFAANPASIRGLREVASKCVPASVNQTDSGALVKLIAQQISSGQLRICSPRLSGPASGDPASSAATPAVDSKPFPLGDLKKRASAQSYSSTAPDPNTLPDNLDAQAQAAALTSAASQGQPICPE